MVIKNVLVAKEGSIEKCNVFINNDGIITKVEIINNNHYIYDSYVVIGNEIIDGEGLYLVPGFIDIHTHGFNGYHSEENVEGLRELAKVYAKRGTLGFCPTIGPRTFEEYLHIIEIYKEAFSSEYEGARFLGLHLEGPFLSPDKAGAIDPEKMYSINLEELEDFLIKAYGYVKTMTIAPEVKNAEEAIKLLCKYEVIPSAGHTNCSFEDMRKVSQAGLKRVTHTFNAMKAFSHKEAGIVDYLLLNDDIYCELIMDGVHVSKEAIKLLIKNKGIDKIIAISDGGADCGIEYEDGYILEDEYKVINGAVYSLKSNILCGSTRDLLSHFRFIKDELNLGMIASQKITSINVGKHFELNLGEVKEGYYANLLLINNDYQIIKTLIMGREFN